MGTGIAAGLWLHQHCSIGAPVASAQRLSAPQRGQYATGASGFGTGADMLALRCGFAWIITARPN
jgi:hypothetical protein